MNTKVFFFLLAAVCLQASALRFRRDDKAVQPSGLDELSQKTTSLLGELGTQFNQLISAKNADEVQSILKTNTDTFISRISDISKSLQAQISDQAGDSNVIGSVVAKLNQTIADLREQNPEVSKKAEEIQAKLQEGFKTVVAETDKLAKTLNENTKDVQEDLAKLSQKAYDQVMETAKSIKSQIHEAANKDDKKA